MKKTLSVLLALVCLCVLLILPADAATDPLAEIFQDALRQLDLFYNFNAEYMIRVVNDQFIDYDNWDWENWQPVVVPAAEYEAMLHKYFVVDEAMLNTIRNFDEYCLKYDEASRTYLVYMMGGFGGMMPERQYLGYVNNGETYDVYYQHITYSYLRDVLPEGTNEDEYAASLNWPENIEYNGIIYNPGPDGYCALLSLDNHGRKYTVEFNEDVVRVLACVEYTEVDLPAAFDDRTELVLDIPADAGVSITDTDCFAGGTVISVGQIVSGDIFETVTQAMETVAETYVAYEFTATLDNVAVQPNGSLAVTFAIPEGYSDNVVVYYMAENGTLEALQSTVDATARTVTATLSHFSTYIVADADTQPHVHAYEAVVTAPTCITEGYTTYTCACGDSYVADKVSVTDHTFGQWEETKAPTYTEQGEQTRRCTHCGQTETRPVDILTPPATDPSKPTEPATEATEPGSAPAETTPAATDPDGPGKDNDTNNLTGIIIAVIAILSIAVVVVIIIRKKR